MKIRQKQWQLYYLGFLDSTSDIDGVWGPISEAATLEFQKTFGINKDGVFGTHTRNKSKEIVSAIQEILKPFSEGKFVVDGLAGPSTRSVTAKYQELAGLPVTGLADGETLEYILDFVPPAIEETPPPTIDTSSEELTGTFWDEIKYFTRDEFRCKCGGRYCNGFPAEPKETLVRLCERARIHFGRPAHLSSPLRCSQHNKNVGGVANSQHMYGEAVDIRIEGVTANDLYSFFKKQPEVRYTYKIDNTYVHVDIPKHYK